MHYYSFTCRRRFQNFVFVLSVRTDVKYYSSSSFCIQARPLKNIFFFLPAHWKNHLTFVGLGVKLGTGFGPGPGPIQTSILSSDDWFFIFIRHEKFSTILVYCSFFLFSSNEKKTNSHKMSSGMKQYMLSEKAILSQECLYHQTFC